MTPEYKPPEECNIWDFCCPLTTDQVNEFRAFAKQHPLSKEYARTDNMLDSVKQNGDYDKIPELTDWLIDIDFRMFDAAKQWYEDRVLGKVPDNLPEDL